MTTQTVFEPFFIISYNVVYTSLPVVVLGVLEQDVCDTLSVRYPRIYWPGLGHRFFNPLSFASAALHGVATSLLVFFVPLGTYGSVCVCVCMHAGANKKDEGYRLVLCARQKHFDLQTFASTIPSSPILRCFRFRRRMCWMKFPFFLKK